MRALVIGLALCAALSACGKKGDPSPIGPPNEIIYPKTYPTH
jgi:predicted small lipoprotein YifL